MLQHKRRFDRPATLKSHIVDQNLQNLAPPLDDTGQHFVLWSLATLELGFDRCGTSAFIIDVPEAHQKALGGETITFSFDPAECDQVSGAECLTFDSRFFRWLVDQLQRPDKIIHAAPTGQPISVHELAQQIFAVYNVENGNVHLSGCTLEDRPFLRLTRLRKAIDSGAPDQLTHDFYYPDGSRVNAELVRGLGLEMLEPLEFAQRLTEVELRNWLAGVEAIDNGDATGEGLVTTVVWCKHAQGKITFTIGDAATEHGFEGWASQLEEGTQKPPPFRCSETGRASYHVAATDDNRLTVSEAIDVCSESGERLLITDLETCSVTGQRAARQALTTCPVTRKRVVRSAMTNCVMCGQQVSPATISSGRCSACRTLQPVSKDDPRMARVLGEYPKLDRWNRWSLTETANSYILIASTMIKRLLVVVKKDSLELVRIASGSRFSRRWPEAPLAEQEHYLKNST